MDFLQVIHHFSLVTASVLLFASMLALFQCWILPVMHNRKLRRSGFTGPPPVFPLGNISEMMQKSKNTSETSSCGGSSGISHDIHSTVFPYFSQWRAKYGKVFIYWLGTEPFLYIADPEFLKQVASGVKSKAWGKPSVFKRDRKPLFGKGLVMAEGDDWSRQRHMITPAFSSTNLKAMMSDMVESTRKMTNKWKNLVGNKGGEINIERDVIQNAAEIIAQTSFGIMGHQHGQKVFEKLIGLQKMLFRPNRLVGVPFCNLFHPLKMLESVRLGQEIDQLLLSTILSKMTGADEQQPDVAAEKNLLSLMIAHNRREKKLSARDIVDECKTFFFGGLETTGLAISWTLLLLALHPEWQCELREEIREVTGGESLDFPMLGQLQKMGWVLKEVIRLYSPSPNAQRQVREDIRSGDVVIPKGTNVWIDVVGMHHDPELWGADVNEFRPERFKAEPQGGCTHMMGYLPFGFGGRMCVGKNLSVMEYKVVLTQILSMFSFSVSPNYFHSPTILLSMRPSSGIRLIIKAL